MTRRSTPTDLHCTTLRKGDDGEVVLLTFTPTTPPLLTEAEREIALAVCQGRTNAEVAARRGVSARTVANQVASLFKKLGVGSRTELAARLTIEDIL